MSKISFVYFDVGGVAIKDFSDSNKWDVMMADMGLDKFDRKIIDDIYDQYENEIIVGKRHVDTLGPIYAEKFGVTFPEGFSMQQYFLEHFDPNPTLWPIIDKLKETTKIGLLTDQYPGLLDDIFARDIMPKVEWNIIVDSSVLGVRKLLPEIYQIAQKEAGVPAEEILFIDNRPKNLVIPKELGWQNFYYDSKDYPKASADLASYLQSQGL